MVLRVLPVLLLCACPDLPPQEDPDPLPRLADELILLDDFDGGPLDGVWRWADGDTRRAEVVGGSLLLGADATHAVVPGRWQATSAVSPLAAERVDALEATVTVHDYESIAGGARVALTLTYQPEADRETRRNLLSLAVVLRTGGSQTLRYDLEGFHCANDDCTAWHPLPEGQGDFPSGVDASLAASHALSVAYDEEAGQIVLSAGGRSTRLDVSGITGFHPDHFLDARIGVEAGTGGGPGVEARMLASVDDVRVNGAAWDDFSGGLLDLERWHTGTAVRRVEDGAAVLASGSSEAGRAWWLPLRDATGVQALAATVAVDELTYDGTPEGAPAAAIGGSFYGTAGGDVFAWAGVRGADAVWTVARCEATCEGAEVLGKGVLASDLAGPEQLYVGFDGTHFTFQAGAGEPASFDAAAVAPVEGPPAVPVLGPMIVHPASQDAPGTLRASFDEVRTSPTGQVTVGDATWTTAAEAGGLASLVAFGADPDEDGRALLYATRGDEVLEIAVADAPEAWAEGGEVQVLDAHWTDAEGTAHEATSGTVTFEHFDGRRADATFRLPFATGSFSTAWLPAATRPQQAGSEAFPSWLNEDCAAWPFCHFAVSGERSTHLAIPASPGQVRVVRIPDDTATVQVYAGPGGALLCEDIGAGQGERACRATATTDSLHVEVTPSDDAPTRVVVALHEDFEDASLETDLEREVAIGGHRWYRFPSATDGAYKVTMVTGDEASGGLALYDDDGRHVVGNGWCCSEGNTQEFFRPEGTGPLWVRLDAAADQASSGYTGSTHGFTLRGSATGTGETPQAAVPKVLSQAFNSFNHILGAGEVAYLSFVPDRSGPFLAWSETMNWGPADGPVDLTLFTDPSDPEGSAVRTSDGTACASALDGADQTWRATCYALLEEGTTYYARLEEGTGRDGVHVAVRVDVPWFEARVVTPDGPLAGTIPANQGTPAGFVTWLEPDTSYNLVGDSTGGPDFGFGFVDLVSPVDGCEWFCWNGLGNIGTWSGPVFGLALPAADAPPFVYVEVWGGDQEVSFDLDLHATPSSAPFSLGDLATVHQDGFLPANGTHRWTFTAATTETRHVDLHGDAWDGGTWLLQDAGGTTVASCTATLDEADPNFVVWRASCPASLQQGETYTLTIEENAGVDRSRYTINSWL